jgi:DNA-binding MarR family transcriptional regulator
VSRDLDIETRIVASIRRIMRAVDLHSRHLVDEFGLTGPQLAVLQAVAEREQATPGGIARSVRISAATTSGILTRLEKRALIVRTRGESDRRTVRVDLTDDGRKALAAAPSLLQDRFREQLAHLEEWERSMILSVLQRIATMMDAEDLEASPMLVTDDSTLVFRDSHDDDRGDQDLIREN